MNIQTKPQVLIPQDEIHSTVRRLAAEITGEYREKNPILLGILKGSFVFLADLARKLDFPLEIEFIRLASYGSGQQSSGRVKVAAGPSLNVAGRHVLVVEDIIDTGVTLNFLLENLKKQKPASLRLCALLDKPSRRKVKVPIDYVGKTVPDRFLVGYGLDFAEKYRNLPDICFLEE
jgi:hypoxanthine phosphoribosyltransferase